MGEMITVPRGTERILISGDVRRKPCDRVIRLCTHE